MYQDASYAALPAADGGFGASRAASPVQRPNGLTWRHVATAGLLLLTLPVFAVAALACLPVLLVAAGGQSLGPVWTLAHTGQPARGSAPTPPR